MQMFFTVLSYIDLEAVLELDDYISAIWNNKYFETGEFEIVLKTTPERIKKLIRNNFIVLNGTNEIAVIEFVQFSKDEDNGATMTVKGSFAQNLLNRRIVWSKTLLKGSVDYEVQRLLKENGIAPSDNDRYLATDGDKKILFAENHSITLPKDFNGLSELQLFPTIQITTQGAGNDYGLYTTRYRIGSSYADVSFNSGVNFEFRLKGVESEVEIYENPLASGVKTIVKVSENGSYATAKTAKFNIRNLFTEEGADDFVANATVTEGTAGSIVEVAIDNSTFADQTPFSNRVIGLSKEDYDNGAFGFTFAGGKLYWRMFWSKEMTDYALLHASPVVYWKQYCYKLYFGHIENSTYNKIASTDYIIADNAEYIKKEVEIYNISSNKYVDFATFSNRLVVTELYQDRIYPYNRNKNTDISIVYKVKGQNERNYIALGTKPNSKEKIELQLLGENVLEKSQELLTLYGLGLKARFDKADKLIYVDIYEGTDRTGNIVFSEDLDNLVSYDIGLSASKPNVALVYSKQEETKDNVTTTTEYFETAGASAGINRLELYLNRTDQAGYIGADYAQQLVNEGTLSLQKATLAIENEIDSDSYIYRTQFALGDIVKVVIKDLDMTFNTRILEVREYNDETGYSIDLVLGE